MGCAISGCATNASVQPPLDTTESSILAESSIPGTTALPSPAMVKTVLPVDKSTVEAGDKHFAKSELIANDFLKVILRVPEFAAGQTSFSASLPRTRYGEILMEQLRQAGYTIVLGQSPELPELSYRVELPADGVQDMHTFFVSVGKVHLKRSYEIVENRVAPVSEMLIAGIDTSRLNPLQPAQQLEAFSSAPKPAPEPAPEQSVGEVVVESANTPTQEPSPFEPETSDVFGPGATADVDASDLNALLLDDKDWNPLDTNLYETGITVYEPLFDDASVDYQEISSQVLVFPNDSLVLGKQNKTILGNLAGQLQSGTDIVRVIGCSHGKTDVVEGNQKLARGRAVRVRDELVLAGVESSAVLHEACWAPRHYDEVMPRRGVVVKHLREQGQG